MLLRRATAHVWERLSLIHTASARDAAGFRQSVMMPVIVRLWVASDTLAGGALMRGMVWSSWRLRALCLASCRSWASWAGVCIPVCFGFLLGRSAVWKGVGQEGAWWRVGCGRSPRVAHVYRVVAAAPSACMVYRSSCRRWLTRTLGAVSSYTCVVWGRWRVTVILAASFLRVVVWGMMQWVAHLSWGVCSSVSSLSGGWSGFGDGGFSWAFVWGATLVSTRYCGRQVSGAPTCVAAAAASWRRAVVLVSRGGAPGLGVRVSWSWYAHQMV